MDSYILAIAGGLLIGLAAMLLMLTLGRVMGMSGIVWRSVSVSSRSLSWQQVFVIGVVLGAIFVHKGLGVVVPESSSSSLGLAVLAGLLVGVGTKLGSGCTSGHGICGISRLSWRSLVATLTFMTTGIITVTLMRAGGAG